MITESVTYEDYEGNKVTQTLNFHVTKTELFEQIQIIDELQEIKDALERAQRNNSDPTPAEAKKLLDLIKFLVKISYGKRSDDGKRFSKKEEHWDEFVETGAYDEFLLSLYTPPENALNFISAILPKDLREQAETEIRNNPDNIPTAPAVLETPKPEAKKNPMDMTHEELLAAFEAKNKDQT